MRLNRRPLAVSICLVLVALLGRTAAAQERPGELVDRVLEAYGGWAQLSLISSYRMEGSLATGHGQALSRTSRAFARPDRLSVVLEHPDRKETRIVDGREGWRSDPRGQIAGAEGPLLDSMRLQAARAALPWILGERRDAVVMGEALERDGGALPCLELALDTGLVLRACVDPGTGRVLRAMTILDSPAMKIAFETRYDDFRMTGDVLFAHVEQNYTGGRHQATTSIERIVVNPDLPEDTFHP